MGRRGEEATAARDYVMARLLAAGASLQAALAARDEAAVLFCDPSGDPSGNKRAKLLEVLDLSCGDASASAQLAMSELEHIDPKEAEPEPDDEEEDDEDEEDKDETEDKPRRRSTR